MQFPGGGGVRDVRAIGDKRVGRLAEEHRIAAVHARAHLRGVLGVVAADAEDAPHRKARGAAGDGGARGSDGKRNDRLRHGGHVIS
jgi:hypothetical protein